MSDPSKAKNEAMIEAIRNDARVGRNSCSSFDECQDDASLVEFFATWGATTPEQALKAALLMQDIEDDRFQDAEVERGLLAALANAAKTA